MTSRLGIALAVSTILASGGVLGAGAGALAQTPPPAQHGAAAPPAPAPKPAPGPGSSAGLMNKPGPARMKGFRGGAFARFSRMSPADRAAMLDAHLAAVKAGLELNADQEKLWGPVEQTIRDGVQRAIQMRQRLQGQKPANPMQRLQRMSQIASAKAAFLRRFVDAAQPLYNALTPDQRRRLPMLMHGVRFGAMGGPRPMMAGRMGGREGKMGMDGRMMRRCMEIMHRRMRMRDMMGPGMRGGEHMRNDRMERWRDHGDWRRDQDYGGHRRGEGPDER